MDAPPHVLPDLVKPGLRIVFCGTAAGTVSAARGAYYAHPQNRFWMALHTFGLTPRKLNPEEYNELPQWGLGLTDIAKHVSGMDRELPAGALGPDACAALKAKIAAAQPEWLAFTASPPGAGILSAPPASANRESASAEPDSGFCRPRRRPLAGTGRAMRIGGGCSPTKRGREAAHRPCLRRCNLDRRLTLFATQLTTGNRLSSSIYFQILVLG
jgi:hypothetical protein